MPQSRASCLLPEHATQESATSKLSRIRARLKRRTGRCYTWPELCSPRSGPIDESPELLAVVLGLVVEGLNVTHQSEDCIGTTLTAQGLS